MLHTCHIHERSWQEPSLAWTLEVTLCYTLVISMKGVDKNHGKSLARTLEVTLCYTLVISMKGVDKNHGKSLAWTLEVTLCYTLVISMKGVDKNHGKSLTSTLGSKLAWVHLQQACMELARMILVMWLLTKISKISCYFLWHEPAM